MTDSTLQITGGRYAGQKLHTPDHREIRPMRGRVREAIFNRIDSTIEHAQFMDCFAGTGAMGLEALSRGAAHVLFLDRSPESITLVRRNLEDLGITEKAELKRLDLFEHPPDLPASETPYRFISVTPPYSCYHDPDDRRSIIKLLEFFYDFCYIEDEGEILLECETGQDPGAPPSGYIHMGSRAFGRTEINYYQKQPTSHDGRKGKS